MVHGRPPDFESSFGERASDRPLVPRRRDRHLAPLVAADDDEPTPSELVGEVESHRAVGDALDLEIPPAAPGDPDLPPQRTGSLVDPLIPRNIRAREAAFGAAPEPDVTAERVQRTPRVGTRWYRIRRRVTTVASLLIVAGLGYYLICLFQVWSTGRADSDEPVDASVAMGAAQFDGRPSPQLAARLDHVAELWPTGIAPLVVVTGGNIPGDRFTEAEASATYLEDRGVPADALVLENEGASTFESLDSVEEILAARGLDRILVVTDPYHALRSRMVAEEVGMTASVSSPDTSVVTGGDSFVRHLEEAGGVAIGRIIGFERLERLTDCPRCCEPPRSAAGVRPKTIAADPKAGCDWLG